MAHSQSGVTEWNSEAEYRVRDTGYWHQAESAFRGMAPGPPIPHIPNAQHSPKLDYLWISEEPMLAHPHFCS